MDTSFKLTALPSATVTGRICAGAGDAQRDLQECAAAHAGLFSGKPFDPALFSTVCLANAFCAPWLSADRLRMANRAALWVFGLDWLIDYIATSESEVTAVVRRCAEVADGAPPVTDDALTQFLAELLADLTVAPAWPALSAVWREEFQKMLDAMAREWVWQAARVSGGELPTFADYLDNADNICFSFIFVSHWIVNSGPPPITQLDEVRTAGRAVQVVIRLLNDLGTYERDVSWGDLNALMLGVTRADIERQIERLVADCQRLLEPLRDQHADLAVFLERYIEFNVGFWGLSDYWGQL